MRVFMAGNNWEWTVRRARRRRWSPLSLILMALLGVVALALLVAVLVLAMIAAVLAGVVYVAFLAVRSWWRTRRRHDTAARRPTAGAHGCQDVRGFLEIARTPDPVERYVLAVREFDRISAATLAVDPAERLGRRVARRVAVLADQADNLTDVVDEIEQMLSARRAAALVLSGVWELSVACRDLRTYSQALVALEHDPTLARVRHLTARRTTLRERHEALIARLRDADLTDTLSLPARA